MNLNPFVIAHHQNIYQTVNVDDDVDHDEQDYWNDATNNIQNNERERYDDDDDDEDNYELAVRTNRVEHAFLLSGAHRSNIGANAGWNEDGNYDDDDFDDDTNSHARGRRPNAAGDSRESTSVAGIVFRLGFLLVLLVAVAVVWRTKDRPYDDVSRNNVSHIETIEIGSESTELPKLLQTQPPASNVSHFSSFPEKVVPVEETNADDLFVPHLVFGDDLRYRRVCAPVHSSLLCLTIRYPFEVPLQDPDKSFPFPVDDRMYTLNPFAFQFLDGEHLAACRGRVTQLPDFESAVQECLDQAAIALDPNEDEGKHVVAVWTKKRSNAHGWTMFGTQFDEQRANIDHHFGGQIVMVFGASPAPLVTMMIATLFGNCKTTPRIARVSNLCSGWGKKPNRVLMKSEDFGWIDEHLTFVGMDDYFPGHKQKMAHYLPSQNMTEHLKSIHFARRNFTQLRNLTIIIEYPLAHAQNEWMIHDEWNTVVEIQTGFPALIMSASSEAGRKELAEMGYRLDNIIAFDGFPQFFPTPTGAYAIELLPYRSEEMALKSGMYKGWKPEYGSKCRGPLPPTSKLTQVNSISRQAFLDGGLDPKWYGRSYEFINQLWWHVRGWNSSKAQLDCTHSDSDGFSSIHKYIIQSMVDDEVDHAT